MKCPHCLDSFHDNWEALGLSDDNKTRFRIRYCTCPACKQLIIQLCKEPLIHSPGIICSYVYPKAIARAPLPSELKDKTVREDYIEACNVLADSAKASAALSRRCLQHILCEKAGTTKHDLADQIEEVVNSGKLPTELSDDLDAVRHIGNFGVHVTKNKNTGEVVPVEPGEAEWNLEVIESLIDYYYVRPSRSQERRIKMNLKLKDAGKPELPVINSK